VHTLVYDYKGEAGDLPPSHIRQNLMNANTKEKEGDRTPATGTKDRGQGGRRYLTENEVLSLIGAALSGRHGARDACLIFWMYRRGWRVSEACALQLGDIDLDARVVYVRRKKNGTPTTHPIAPDEYKALRAWLKVRESYKGSVGPAVFLSERGEALDRRQVNVMLAKCGERACLSVHPHPHMLRHACGYSLANAGHDTRAIQTYLGHRSITSTTIYTETNVGRFMAFWV
jgi:type 1 fimbriae regulatory protein FimB